MTQEQSEPAPPEGPCSLTLELLLFDESATVEEPTEEFEDIPEAEVPEPEELFTFDDPVERVNDALDRVYEGPENCGPVVEDPPRGGEPEPR